MYSKWLDQYKSKLKTLDEAAAMIKDGEEVYCALGGGQPFGMFEAIGQRIKRGELARGCAVCRQRYSTDSINRSGNTG